MAPTREEAAVDTAAEHQGLNILEMPLHATIGQALMMKLLDPEHDENDIKDMLNQVHAVPTSGRSEDIEILERYFSLLPLDEVITLSERPGYSMLESDAAVLKQYDIPITVQEYNLAYDLSAWIETRLGKRDEDLNTYDLMYIRHELRKYQLYVPEHQREKFLQACYADKQAAEIIPFPVRTIFRHLSIAGRWGTKVNSSITEARFLNGLRQVAERIDTTIEGIEADIKHSQSLTNAEISECITADQLHKAYIEALDVHASRDKFMHLATLLMHDSLGGSRQLVRDLGAVNAYIKHSLEDLDRGTANGSSDQGIDTTNADDVGMSQRGGEQQAGIQGREVQTDTAAVLDDKDDNIHAE